MDIVINELKGAETYDFAIDYSQTDYDKALKKQIQKCLNQNVKPFAEKLLTRLYLLYRRIFR
jgi:vacuolar-type H+-ATPase subunit C/Vma6